MIIFTTIYFWLIGGLWILIVLIYILIAHKILKPDALYRSVSRMLRFWFRLMFIRIEKIYEEKPDFSKPHIFMPNHVSFIDVYLAGAVIPTYVNALEAHTHFKWFLYGSVIRKMGQIPINRLRPKSSWNSFLTAIERLKSGRSIIVFPEGTRSGDGHLQEFKKIPFKFAKESGFDLIPMAFIGIEKMRKNKIFVKPSPIRVVFGKKITAAEMQKMTVEELKEKVKNKIKSMLEKYAFV